MAISPKLSPTLLSQAGCSRTGFLSQAQAPPTATGAKRGCPSPQKWAHPTSPEDYRVEGTKALGWGSRVQHLQLQKMRPPRHYQYSHAGSGKLTDWPSLSRRFYECQDYTTLFSQTPERGPLPPSLEETGLSSGCGERMTQTWLANESAPWSDFFW